MRIGIVTFHFVNNFGGALQAYALQKIVEKECDAEAIVVNYHNWFIRFTDSVRILPITTNIKEFISGWSTIRLRLDRLHKFRRFMLEKNKLTSYYASNKVLCNTPPNCDKYICGSDQIWNTAITFTLAKPYFLAFEPESVKKFSYAASFDSNHINPLYATQMGRYINALNNISVRENDGIKVVQELANREAIQLIDPTFLLEKEDWKNLAVLPTIKEPYILLYIMQQDKKVYAYIKQIKDQLGIKVVEISRYGYKPNFIDISLINVGPTEFLGLFQNAAYICTNSYHGLAFSLIFEKEFCLIPCRRFSNRITSLLELLHIKLPYTDGKCLAGSAKYDKVQVKEILNHERKKAIDYLQRNIWERPISND
ncbi:MAG: polysaccharide pyruvyl transferase family protein [Anaerotruncus sp.]|nr:polysaccharide pyruvyl transferase family protein [Anaerotruncus sp.]